MTPSRPTDPAALVLGYLNFSSGSFDPAAWRAMNDLFATIETAPGLDGAAVAEGGDSSAAVASALRHRLAELEASEPAFRQSAQARAAIDMVLDVVPKAYRDYHSDLIEHQPRGAIERPFFLMAVAQAVLAEGAGGDDLSDPVSGRLVERVLARLNDYVGWRPVAVLENGRLSEPYPHERVRPIPIFINGAGPAHGRYRDLVQGAIDILAAAPPDLMRQADFDLAMLEELAIDPRAFDFLHPAASRPNYLFGLWDPGRIDTHGCYRRMVVQQATLDGILSWPCAAGPEQPEAGLLAELRRESSAVLAGVMLMASGLSGHGPGAHQAGLPLAELLPRIAGYRDAFYRWLVERLPEPHRDRLNEETHRLRQPFGGVRRHINTLLAGRRARQVESVALSAVMSRLGRATEAERLAGIVPAASARMLARISGSVVAARQALQPAPSAAGGAGAALDHLDTAADLLFRAVGCGATVDPWNILGLAGQFPLHEPGGESLTDPRVDDLITTTGSILDGYAAVWRQAAIGGAIADATRASNSLERLATWWDRFATTTVSGVEHLSGREVRDSTREVIESLDRRHESGPEPPPPGFWRKEVASFSSPRSHAQAADALLREGDLDGAMGLLVHWASLLEGQTLDQLGGEWLAAAARWMGRAFTDRSPAGRSRVRRFLELVDANTSGIADIIEMVAAGRDPGGRRGEAMASPGEAEDEHPDAQESVASAYESMVWRDSTDDGVDGGMLEFDLPGGTSGTGPAALEQAADFLAGCARLVQHAVTASCAADIAEGGGPTREEIDATVAARHSMRRQRRAMIRAAMLITSEDIATDPGMPAAELERLRWQLDAAAERLIEAAVKATETSWMLSARLRIDGPRQPRDAERRPMGRGLIGPLFAAILQGDAPQARELLDRLCNRLVGKAVLYVPLSRGGRPDRIVRARCRERLLAKLAACLPRIGLVTETTRIVLMAKGLEGKRPAGGASVSEFDRVFEAATMSLVERIVESAHVPAPGAPPVDDATATQRILDGLALLVPRLLETWMTHARQLRLSVLERVREQKAFDGVREFVEQYGSGLFTQHLLAPPSLRGILRGGVKALLERLIDRDQRDHGDEIGQESPSRRPAKLLDDLASGRLTMKSAQARIRLVLESVAENHAEYRDWNSTTTQSDRGECVHVLLDFLRIKAEYDRITWTLRPVTMAHRVLARRGESGAATAWRRRLRDETAETAAGLTKRLADVERETGVRLASVGDRIRRAFTAPLEQDDLESFVEPAVSELSTGSPHGAGARLEEKARGFLGVASGSGVEVPEWLERLTITVDRTLERADVETVAATAFSRSGSLPDAVAWAVMPWSALHESLSK
ncbi:MAG: hypothetical protein ACKOYJ_11760 [Planctomycetia bacterium]